MADIADRASEVIELSLSANLSRICHKVPVLKSRPRQDCAECGEAIHPARGALGYETCIECATLAERARK